MSVFDIPGTRFADTVKVRKVRFASGDGAFAVIDASSSEGDDIVLVGPLSHLEEREHVRVTGVWQDDKRFGPQVKVKLAEPVPPSGEEALLAYLKRVRHIGATRAAKLLDKYGDHVLVTIDDDPGLAFRRLGLNPQRAKEATKSWNELRSTRALHLLLAPHGLAWLVPRIANEYGERAHEVVRKRPYELTSVFGVGFQIADTIARAAGIGPEAPGRRRAAVVHVLSEAERDGSTCLPIPELASKAQVILGGGAAPDAALLQDMADHVEIVFEQDADGTLWAYRPPTAALEEELALTINALLKSEASLKPARLDSSADMVPAPEQASAVEAAFASRLSIVT